MGSVNAFMLVIKYNPLFVMGLFFVMYDPPLFSFNSMHIVGLFSWIYIFPHINKELKKRYLTELLFFLMIFIYSLSVAFLNNHSLSSAAFPLYYVLDIIPFACAINKYKNKHKLTLDHLFQWIMFAGTLQCISTIVAFFVPEIQRIIVDRIISFGGTEAYNYWATLRMFGFSNGLFFITPILQAMIAVAMFFYSSNHGKKYILLGLLFIASAVINARTSLIVLAIGLILLIFVGKFSTKQRIVLILFVVFTIIAFFGILLPYLETASPATYVWLMDGMDEISGFLHGNKESGYFSYLFDARRYVIPDDIFEFMFGTGSGIMVGRNNLQSDVGYINDIWRIGILGLLVLYFHVFSCIWKIKQNKNKLLDFLGLYLLTTFIVANFKGQIFNMNGVLNLTIIMYLVFGATEKEQMQNGRID